MDAKKILKELDDTKHESLQKRVVRLEKVVRQLLENEKNNKVKKPLR